MLLASIAMSAAMLSPTLGVGQEAPATAAAEAPIRLEDLAVQGTRRRPLIDRFVANVAQPSTNRQVARWRRGDQFCVGVMNMPQATSQYVADRIGDVARGLELRVGAPGCTPNVFMIAADQSNAGNEWLRTNLRPVLMRNESGTTAGRRSYDRFVENPAPVRWWHVSYVTSIHNDTGIPGDPIIDRALQGVRKSHQTASRILTGDADYLRTVFIVFDPTRLTHLTADQLADYLAFLSLAQVNPEADTEAYDSILNVVAHPNEVAGLTNWDKAYLQGLYSAQRTQRIAGAARDEIANSIERQARLMEATDE